MKRPDLQTSMRSSSIAAPRLSVVLPTHNRPALLVEALDSIAAQSFGDLEVIVVDDASVLPVDFALLSRRYPNLRGVRHDKPRGGAAAKNSGIAAARGEYFAFLDDDDLYDPRYLERSIATLERHPEIEVLFMGVDWFGSDGEHGARAHAESMGRTLLEARPAALEATLHLFSDALLPALLRRVPMPFQRPVVRRSSLERIGVYRDDCLLWDCEWAFRAAMVCRCALLDEPLYRQRSDGQGYSSLESRERDHLESGLEMTLRLYRQPPFAVSATTRGLLREAASRSAAYLAYYHSRRGEVGSCIRAWWTSETIQPSIRRLRMPFAALAHALGTMREARP